MTDYSPVTTIGADRPGDWIVLCDHATNYVPDFIANGDLGLPPEDMARHIAWDPGALGVSLEMGEAFGGPVIYSNFSRLVIDPNRGDDDPTLVRKIYDGSIIPGNRHADADEVQRRVATMYQPYHDGIRALIDARLAAGRIPRLISIHSFTPQLIDEPPRPWELGLLWDRDDRIFRPLMDRLASEPLTVGNNEPYSGRLAGDCMWMHGTSRGIPHLLIEVRNDLIQTEGDQQKWGKDLARWLAEAMESP